MLKRICPVHQTNVNYETFCAVCDFYDRASTGCVAMKLGDKDLYLVRLELRKGDNITSGKYSKTGRG